LVNRPDFAVTIAADWSRNALSRAAALADGLGGRVLIDALEQVVEVVVRINAVHSAGDQ
jgi:hypothetical protein